MSDGDEYEFKFDAYTPATIPMERLAMYMAALAKLLGYEHSVHFDRLETGSTRQFARVEKEAAPKVATRIDSVNRGDAANDAMAGYDELNHLLKDDNAIGVLNRRPAGQQVSALVLEFAGRNLPRPVKFGPFTEPAVVDGELVRIGGKDQTAHAQITDPEGKTWSGEMSRGLAQEMAPYLYKGPVLRVRGDAKWERLEDGTWKLLSFKINDFEKLEDDTLDDATSRLRGLHDSDWSALDDLDEIIKTGRGESDGLH